MKNDAETYGLRVVSVRLAEDAPIMSGNPVRTPLDAVELIGREMCGLDREVVCILHLMADGTPISCTFASMGAADQSLAHPRELLKAAILSNATGMILIHNHPSGDVGCSELDTVLTQRIVDVCDLIEIPLLDSIIVGGNNANYFSYREGNVLPLPKRSVITDYRAVKFKAPEAAELKSWLGGGEKR